MGTREREWQSDYISPRARVLGYTMVVVVALIAYAVGFARATPHRQAENLKAIRDWFESQAAPLAELNEQCPELRVVVEPDAPADRSRVEIYSYTGRDGVIQIDCEGELTLEAERAFLRWLATSRAPRPVELRGFPWQSSD